MTYRLVFKKDLFAKIKTDKKLIVVITLGRIMNSLLYSRRDDLVSKHETLQAFFNIVLFLFEGIQFFAKNKWLFNQLSCYKDNEYIFKEIYREAGNGTSFCNTVLRKFRDKFLAHFDSKGDDDI